MSNQNTNGDSTMTTAICSICAIGLAFILLLVIVMNNRNMTAKEKIIKGLRQELDLARELPPMRSTIYLVNRWGDITVMENAELRHESYYNSGEYRVHVSTGEHSVNSYAIRAQVKADTEYLTVTAFVNLDMAVRQSLLNSYRYMIRLQVQQMDLDQKMKELSESQVLSTSMYRKVYGEEIDADEVASLHQLAFKLEGEK